METSFTFFVPDLAVSGTKKVIAGSKYLFRTQKSPYWHGKSNQVFLGTKSPVSKIKVASYETTSYLFGCRTRIRTLTNGVRDRCATVTQFGNEFYNSEIIAKQILKINMEISLFYRLERRHCPDLGQFFPYFAHIFIYWHLICGVS